MLPTANTIDPLDLLRQGAIERDNARREREARREERKREEHEREEQAQKQSALTARADVELGAQWAEFIRKEIEQRFQCVTEALGQALGEDRGRQREECRAMINEALVKVLVERNPISLPPPATLDQKDVDQIVARAVDAIRDYVRECIDDERRALIKLLEAETTARQAAIAAVTTTSGQKDADRIIDRAIDATRDYVRDRMVDERKVFTELLAGENAARDTAIAEVVKALRRELKTIVKHAVLPLKCELAVATRSIVKSWRVDRESYTLTATMGDGSTCEISLRGLFEQFQSDTE